MRTILHVDANCFYASCECLYRPSLQGKAVAVCGDPEARHGIVLTATYPAKRKGVKVGMAIWQAKQACPDLICVPPDYQLYTHISKQLHGLLEDYTDKVESFGLDEAWAEVSGPQMTIERGALLADEIRERVQRELGITVSVGVADNKVMAKLGSDYKKPNATTALPPSSYPDIVWPLPVSDLLYVGPATTRKLFMLGIRTIGQLALADDWLLAHKFGKIGYMLKAFALGLDNSPVAPVGAMAPLKSIGNSTTPPHDIRTYDDAKEIVFLLSESIAARLRENSFKTKRISLSARDTELKTTSHQMTLRTATCLARDIADGAMRLFGERYIDSLPYRSIGINCSQLVPANIPVQLDMFGDEDRVVRQESLERSIDGLRSRFGHQVVRRGVILTDMSYAKINPKEEHVIHPVAFMR